MNIAWLDALIDLGEEPDKPIKINMLEHVVSFKNPFYWDKESPIVFDLDNCCFYYAATNGAAIEIASEDYIPIQSKAHFFVHVSQKDGVTKFTTSYHGDIHPPKLKNIPLEAGKNMSNQSPMSISADDIVPANRTLALIYANADSSSEFKERSGRLVESLNNADTMKAVIITVNGSDFYNGLKFAKPNDGETPDLTHVKQRFVQVLEVKDGHC